MKSTIITCPVGIQPCTCGHESVVGSPTGLPAEGWETRCPACSKYWRLANAIDWIWADFTLEQANETTRRPAEYVPNETYGNVVTKFLAMEPRKLLGLLWVTGLRTGGTA